MVENLRETEIRLKRIFVESRLLKELLPLQTIANNLWWSWDQHAIALFQAILPDHWEALNYNPIAILERLSPERADELVQDKAFMDRLHTVDQAFQNYISKQPDPDAPRIAYFSMEYGLHISVRLYSGGLGILAGDYLKEASDQNIDLTAVGLLYRYGYFQQAISLHGDQINNYPPQEYTKLPMEPVRDDKGEWMKIEIYLHGRVVLAKVWALHVGRIQLYLLDTDINENSWEDRTLTHHLYGGDREHRLKQEILLGIGGVRLLEALQLKADIYHCNEGHAAFMGLERMRNLIHNNGLSPQQALETVRASSLFTTHTPVPAGHDYFNEELLRSYLDHYVGELKMGWEEFLSLGKKDLHDKEELFSMSHLAIRLSQGVNGVSKLHGTVSQQMFKPLYPGYHSEELHIGYVTNGVHYPTWISSELHDLYLEVMGKDFLNDQSNKSKWEKVQEVPANRIMEIRRKLKGHLLDYVAHQLRKDLTRRGDKPSMIFEILNGIRKDALILGFARRFATYKRAHLLFSNLERLSELVNSEEHPVMFIFAGKAHPADQPGQQLIKDIIQVSKRPEFAGKVIFLEGYNMEMAKLLVQGVDIWLNTPTRPLEASGTSGMKAAMNGVMNFSVLDGWWAEGYRPDSGWALPLERTYDDQSLQDELDAETLYNILENEIVPSFFNPDEEAWAQKVKNIICKVGPDFTMKRMMDDYFERFYLPQTERSREMAKEDFKEIKAYSHWKMEVRKKWEGVHLLDRDVFDTDNFSLTMGESFNARITLYCNGIDPEHIGMDAVFFKRMNDHKLELKSVVPMPLIHQDGQQAVFSRDLDPPMSGVFEYGFRIYPKHPYSPHKQDLPLVKWVD